MPRGPSKIDLLADIPLFSACTKKELSKIASLADQVSVDNGTEVTTEGARGWEFFVIADGAAGVYVGGRKIDELRRGDFFGEMALLDQGPRSATVKALGPMSLYVIGAKEFRRLLDEVPFVSRRILQGMAKRLRGLASASRSEWSRL